MKHHVVKK